MEDADLAANREVVEAFLTAAREGSFEALLAVLDPNIVVRYDAQILSKELRGAAAVASEIVEHARLFHSCRTVLVDGSVGVVVAPYGRLLAVVEFRISNGKIIESTASLDPTRLRQMELAVLDA
jgi:RNA polymerase sigma-70 factor (ECF subfamily)